MEKVLVATPLRNGSTTQPHSFATDISIQSISPILWDLTTAKRYISEEDRDSLDHTDFWLCAAKQVDNPWTDDSNELFEKTHRAMYAFQIIQPTECQNVYMKFNVVPKGYDNIGSLHWLPMHGTVITNLAIRDEQQLRSEFDTILAGVNRAFDEQIIRLQNPILLLEYGFQLRQIYLSTMLWVAGLDMLFMAGEKRQFVDRVCGFLGEDTLVFPRLESIGQQPHTCVKDIVADLYELRNRVAHGLEIPARPFREKFDVFDTKHSLVDLTPKEYLYSTLLMESALFLLCRSIYKIIVGQLIDEIKQEAKWKSRLKISAKVQKIRTEHQ